MNHRPALPPAGRDPAFRTGPFARAARRAPEFGNCTAMRSGLHANRFRSARIVILSSPGMTVEATVSGVSTEGARAVRRSPQEGPRNPARDRVACSGPRGAGHPVIPGFTSGLKRRDRLRPRGADTTARELRRLGACLAALGRQCLFGKTRTAIGDGRSGNRRHSPVPGCLAFQQISYTIFGNRREFLPAAAALTESGRCRYRDSDRIGVRKPPGDRA